MGRRLETGLIVPDSAPKLWPRGELVGVLQDKLRPRELANAGSKGIWPKLQTNNNNLLFPTRQQPATAKSQNAVCASVTVIQAVVHLAVVHPALVHLALLRLALDLHQIHPALVYLAQVNLAQVHLTLVHLDLVYQALGQLSNMLSCSNSWLD